ncbi:hypothetical protein LTR70_009075 [Exophiala xenobiotica]|uniref:Aminoglycoside phosphotransferase domain-containing protein n=1 Tax=Lithohypha guttulata TaxID=1690604 RepID=A0ABR0K8K0_9EURO|nr:hypothetical protein LTR24_005599 [Lithohypha guttulata]KAK5311027.1 hypothetical protein LTR70_009075 [Exophiala xenobiotica]
MADTNSDIAVVAALNSSISDDNTASDTSTLVYSQEAFETYQDRVKEIAQKTWPGLEKDHISIERMHGGSYNRITGISFQTSESEKPQNYVLRDPRFPDLAPLTNQLAPLQFLYNYSKLPIPKMVSFNCSNDNALARPYIIQERAPGNSIIHEYPEMSHQSRLTAARQLGCFYNDLTLITGNRIGKLVPFNTDLTVPWTFDVQTFIERINESITLETGAYSSISAPDAAYQGLLRIFKYRYDADLADPYDFRAPYDSSFITMTKELYALGYLRNTPLTLCHLDLEVRNILVDPSNDIEPVSAILDWDSAVFAPVFMACTPPMWLWAWKEGEDEDEREANELPASTENQELKQVFEIAAGRSYMRFAYDPAYRLARRLVHFALFGIHSAEQEEEAEEMLKEWSEVKSKSPEERGE